MTFKKLDFNRWFFFYLICLLGVSFLVLFAVFTQKIFSGFMMQLIFLVDAILVHPTRISLLLLRPDFISQMIFGILWLYFLYRFISATFNLNHQILSIHGLLKSLPLIRHSKNYYVFKSSQPQVFTAGFIFPQIFLSQKLLQISSQAELSSILFHEQSHLLNHDPLKNLIIDFVFRLLPPFPLKTYLFGQFQVLTEIGCDSFSNLSTSDSRSLISALLKIQKYPSNSLVSSFSAQSERIKILIGQKTQPLKSILLTNLGLIAFLLFVSVSLSRANVFYQCQHLVKCFENLVSPDHISPPPSTVNHHCL